MTIEVGDYVKLSAEGRRAALDSSNWSSVNDIEAVEIRIAQELSDRVVDSVFVVHKIGNDGTGRLSEVAHLKLKSPLAGQFYELLIWTGWLAPAAGIEALAHICQDDD